MKLVTFFILILIQMPAWSSPEGQCELLFKTTSRLESQLKELVPDRLMKPATTKEPMEPPGEMVILDSKNVRHFKAGVYSFVIPAEGRYKGRFILADSGNKHLSLGFSKVLSAGEFKFDVNDNVSFILAINNGSGTFRMSPIIIRVIVEALISNGIPFSHFEYSNWLWMPMMDVTPESIFIHPTYHKMLKFHNEKLAKDKEPI